MAPIRLRHPKGVSTVEVAVDDVEFTVLDLQQEIYAVTDILPSRQLLRTGYPTRSLTLIPELPVSSLGLQRGDQIIVNEASAQSIQPISVESPPSIPVPPASSQSGLASHPPVRAPTSSGPDFVEVDGSYLVHRVVPDDNSCLFSSVALAFEQNIAKAPLIRKIVAEGIKNNSDIYNEAILGMPPNKYVDTITKSNSWGGAIELTVLAAHYNTEITSIDVETGRIDHYTPPNHDSGTTTTRCILIYSGIHYDAVSLAPSADAPGEWHQTIFEIRSTEDSSDPVLIAAKKLADILRSKKAFTNTATFDLKCEQCGKGLKGEKEARTHAEQTGHVHFGEY